MKMIFALAFVLIITFFLSSCNIYNNLSQNNSENTNSSISNSLPKEQPLYIEDVMNYVTTTYPQYNTFVLIENTVHIMNCHTINQSELQLVREIGSITDGSYEVFSFQQLEDRHRITKNKYIYKRIDVINIEDSNNVWSKTLSDFVEDCRTIPDSLKQMYDLYDVIVRESSPNDIDYIGQKDVTIIELMGHSASDPYTGFELMHTTDDTQVLVFPFDYLFSKYTKDELVIKIWPTNNSSGLNENQNTDTESSAVLDEFVKDMLYGNSNSDGEECLYNIFIDYESFYGPQTQEQMRSILDESKELLRETVYVNFAKSYDHAILDSVIQTAHIEMETWWSEYISIKNQ